VRPLKGTLTKDIALLVLRLSGLGLAFAHGWAKVIMLVSGQGGPFIDGVEALGFPFPLVFAWAATLTEMVGGLAIALGIGTRLAAAFSGVTMFVAAFLRHHFAQHVLVFFRAMAVPDEVVESWGSPERAMCYLLIFVALVLMGGGRFSLDRMLRRGA